MTQLSEAEWLREPLVPVTTSEKVPAFALPRWSVSWVALPVATVLDANEAVAPAGSPLIDSDTLPLNPPLPAMATLATALAVPWLVTEFGEAVTAKSGPVLQAEVAPPTKQTDKTECNSTPLGATPVCPCSKSKKPTPVTMTGTLAIWKLVETAG